MRKSSAYIQIGAYVSEAKRAEQIILAGYYIMSTIAQSTDLIIKPPFSNYLGGNTARYETAQTQLGQMKGGSSRRLFLKSYKKPRRTRGRKYTCKTKRRRSTHYKKRR